MRNLPFSTTNFPLRMNGDMSAVPLISQNFPGPANPMSYSNMRYP